MYAIQVADYQGQKLTIDMGPETAQTPAGVLQRLFEIKTGILPSTGQRNRVKTLIVTDPAGVQKTYTRNVWVVIEDETGTELTEPKPELEPMAQCGICGEDVPLKGHGTRFRDANGVEKRICPTCIADPVGF